MANISSNIFQKRERTLMNWVSYWRKNPQRFAQDYLGINLFLYQRILLYMMERVSIFMYVAARGQGKSFIIAVYCVLRCILYPNTEIVLASGVKKQAQLIITAKIVSLYNNHPAVRAEIGDRRNIKEGANDTSVSFLNGSKISAVASNDNARGYRCNILILDEFRLIDKKVIDEALIPMLNVNRQPAFKSKAEYVKYPTEENKTIYISSAWYKTHWIWNEFQDTFKKMIGGKSYFVAAIPYQLSVFHGLLSKQKATNDRLSYDKATYDMEYEALFVGENERGYFKLEDINNCRTINKSFVPPSDREVIENRNRSVPKKLSNIPRIDKESEIRIVSLDVALMGGNKNVKNDSSAFSCIRLVQEGTNYRRDVLYLESIMKSVATEELAIRLKQLYHDFEADYVVVDTNGVGAGVFDSLASITYDEDRDIEYPAWSAINDEDMNERVKAKGIPVIYSIKGNAKLNSDVAVELRTALEKGKMRLLINDIEKRESLVSDGGFIKLSLEEQQRQLYSFQQTSALANELVSLEYVIRSANISIQEVGTATKDRYSSLGYGNYFANKLEKELKDDKMEDMYEDLFFISSYRE